MFFEWGVGGAFEGHPFDDVVVFEDSFHPTPEIEFLVVVLLAEFEHCDLEVDFFLGGEGLADAVDEFEL